MYPIEENFFNVLKILFIFLITMLATAVISENFIIILLLFYIAFIKD